MWGRVKCPCRALQNCLTERYEPQAVVYQSACIKKVAPFDGLLIKTLSEQLKSIGEIIYYSSTQRKRPLVFPLVLCLAVLLSLSSAKVLLIPKILCWDHIEVSNSNSFQRALHFCFLTVPMIIHIPRYGGIILVNLYIVWHVDYVY